MNIKGILRSTAAKFIAFAGIVGCFAAAVIIGENAIAGYGRDGMIYQFETDFSQSSYMAGQVNNTAVTLEAALEGGISRQEFEQQTRDFPGSYYGVMNGTVISNAELNDSATQNAAFYLIARPDDATQSNISWYYMPFDDEPIDEYNVRSTTYPLGTVIRVCVTSEQAAQYQEMWSAQKNTFTYTIYIVLMLTAAALALFVYLLFVTGRRPEDEEMHLVTLDRLPVEGNVLLFWSVLGLAGGLNIALTAEIANGSGDLSFLLLPSVLFVVAAFAFALELTLSLVRLLKAGSLARRSWCIRAFRWSFNKIGVLCTGTWHGLGRLRLAFTKAILGNYKTRNVVLLFTAYSVVLAFLAAAFAGVGGSFFAFVLGVGWFLAAGYFLIRRIDGFDRIVAALQRMRGGDLSFRLTDMPEGVFAAMAEDLGSLGDGMQAALQNEVRAERMKSELITNVSHDLKTPLTSILSYSDLLSQLELTPEEANDYAKIIHQKSLRLKNLTSDLFDISKVQSGVEQMVCERLDAVTLVRQALAEQEAQNSGLVLKVTLPERELPIWADGRKMSRVLENLIGNCVKYAMKGTRVFVSLDERDGKAVFEVKNTANYEMDFAADEITERFVRGDAARSTEGSGLGLAIAKSYTEACGGMFEVEVDGDQFKVRISFPVYGL
ncbi:MAG: HAMP domain-containing sensor histidine kinase [Agathobaculum sp.]|nr:HAMP domain-containing sensor histidine kinase [Agathobaculum sp.]